MTYKRFSRSTLIEEQSLQVNRKPHGRCDTGVNAYRQIDKHEQSWLIALVTVQVHSDPKASLLEERHSSMATEK